MEVLILSCDKFSDTWPAFFHCYNKYFTIPYQTHILSETKDCRYASTIKATGAWTTRVETALKQIKSDKTLILLDDFFIRSKVDSKRIIDVLDKFDDNTAVYNFELGYRKEKGDWVKRAKREPYLNSCQPSIHDRLKLIERLQKPQNPWEFETAGTVDSPYDFYINNGDIIIDIGYYNHKPFSIKAGKWCREIMPFFESEGIEMNYSERGFWD